MSPNLRLFILFLAVPLWTASGIAVGNDDKLPPLPGETDVVTDRLQPVGKDDWGETHVRRVLRAFAYGGLATDAQIERWARMRPERAVAQILRFNVNNERLSPAEDASADRCGSLESLQEFWASDDAGNPMNQRDRGRYATLNGREQVAEANLQRTWTQAVSTRGCNPFLHKTALFLTNYHASIHVQNTRPALIRAYYDDYLEALVNGLDFVEVMTVGARHAAVARAYGHQRNRVRPNGKVEVNEDFAREYLQLFFGIPGTTEDTTYYEEVSVKNNALLLTGMNLDREENAYGSVRSGDWYVAPLIFNDHRDSTGRRVMNRTFHYASDLDDNSCLEVLHAQVCGGNAGKKLDALGRVAGAHPESMANIPVAVVRFFADDNLDWKKIKQIRGSWTNSSFDLLAFLREYAASTAFHHPDTVKYFTAFDRNLTLQNATTLSNEETFARGHQRSPYYRMRNQGMEVFEPVRNVFGHQTGLDAANNPYIFKNAFQSNSGDPYYYAGTEVDYQLQKDGPEYLWRKDWGSVIPVNGRGEHVVGEVATWLWNRLIGDGGRNFDPIARAQVHALLARGRDFAATVDPENPEPDPPFTSADILGRHDGAWDTDRTNAARRMDFGTRTANYRVGMAINFISMTPYAFAMEGR